MDTLIETKLTDFKEIFELSGYFLSPFIFRGHSSSKWELTTSIERTIIDFALVKFGLEFGYETEEKWMLNEFKKKYHLYSSSAPKHNDNFEWLAIMQHHGAPTRLLDFTESLFVALYFSVIESKSDSAIWCINRYTLRDILHDKYNLDYDKRSTLKDSIDNIHIDLANRIIAKSEDGSQKYDGSVIPLEPNIYSERLSRQQGLFLMPTDSTIPFFENLILSFGLTDKKFAVRKFDDLINELKVKDFSKLINVIKIIIPNELHNEITRYLKEMNITAEILFPGVDGLAKSLVQTHIRT
jgi:hypothetical protein